MAALISSGIPNSAGLKLWTILPHSSRNWISATCAGWFAGAGSSLSVRSRRPLAIGGDQLAIKIGEAFAQIALVQFDAEQQNRGGRARSISHIGKGTCRENGSKYVEILRVCLN